MNAKANNTIDKVQQLQRKLYLSAKRNSNRRYHALYDKIYRADILIKDWKQVKANMGVGGIDGIEINDVIAYGEVKLLSGDTDRTERKLLYAKTGKENIYT